MAASVSHDGASSSNKQSTPIYHSHDVTGKQVINTGKSGINQLR